MNNITKIRTVDGMDIYRGEETGPRGGTQVWYAAALAGRPLGDRALWCRTVREAAQNHGATNVAHGV